MSSASNNILWLTEPGENVAAAVPVVLDLQRIDYPFPPEVGTGHYEQIVPSAGVKIYASIHRLHSAADKLVTVGEAASTLPETTLHSSFIRGGTSVHHERIPLIKAALKPGIGFFRLANAFDMTLQVNASSDSKLVGCALAVTPLTELLGANLTEVLLAGIGLGTPPSVRMAPIPQYVSEPLFGAVASTFSGNLRLIYAQGKLLEYLCLLAQHVVGPSAALSPPDRRRDAARQLRDDLARLDGEVPTLEQLARRFGMSAKSLNDGFVAEYGQSIYAWITECRLREAHAALLESDVPMKALAARLGYAHVNNFITAFGRAFGYTRGSLRRRQKSSPAAEKLLCDRL